MKKYILSLAIISVLAIPMFQVLADEVEPVVEPIVEPVVEATPTPTPKPLDAIMISTLSPNINGQVKVSGQTVNFLTYQFGEGGVLLSKVKTGVIANGITGGLLAGTPDWSYKIMEGNVATYHTIQIPAGNWFITPFTVNNGQVYYGTEFEI